MHINSATYLKFAGTLNEKKGGMGGNLGLESQAGCIFKFWCAVRMRYSQYLHNILVWCKRQESVMELTSCELCHAQ